MSFFSLFGIGKKSAVVAGKTGRSKRYYIVDCAMMESSKGERGRMGPRNQLDLLRRLSRFVKKEQIELCAVFDGKELRDAPDGQKFMDVMVVYVAQVNDVPKTIGTLCAGKRNGAMVITSDKVVEQIAQRNHAELMHTSTFKKALEADGGAGGSYGGGERSERPSGRPERGPGRRNGPRSGMGGPRRPNRQGGEGAEGRVEERQASDQASAPEPEERNSGRAKNDEVDAVSDLIDLV